MKIRIKDTLGRVRLRGEATNVREFILERLREGEDDFSGLMLAGENFSAMDFRGANLSGANLSKCDLSGANLNSTYLVKTRFNQANLQNSSFEEVCAILADFSYADMRNAMCQNSDFHAGNFRGATLRKAQFGDSELGHADFTGADVHEMGMCEHTCILEANLEEAIGYESDPELRGRPATLH